MAGSFQQTMRKYERGRVEKMNLVKLLCLAGPAIVQIQEKIPSGVKLPVRRTVTVLA